jgi:hypothetical protein
MTVADTETAYGKHTRRADGRRAARGASEAASAAVDVLLADAALDRRAPFVSPGPALRVAAGLARRPVGTARRVAALGSELTRLDLLLDLARERAGIRDQRGVDHHADRDLAAVAEDAQAHSDVARGGRPEEHRADRCPAAYMVSLGPGTSVVTAVPLPVQRSTNRRSTVPASGRWPISVHTRRVPSWSA